MVRREFHVGQRVGTIPNGWGTITDIDLDLRYPIRVVFDNESEETFTKDGRVANCKRNRDLLTEAEAAAVFETLASFGPDIPKYRLCLFFNSGKVWRIGFYKEYIREHRRYVCDGGASWLRCEPLSDGFTYQDIQKILNT